MFNTHDGVTKQDGLTTEYKETTEKEDLHSECSACSVVGFLAGNRHSLWGFDRLE